MNLKIYIKNFIFTPSYFTWLLGCIHKWIGPDNNEHGNISLYSYSHIYRDYFYFSSFYPQICQRLIDGIRSDPAMWLNVYVSDVEIISYESVTTIFRTTSPIFCRRDGIHIIGKEATLISKNILMHKAKIANIELPPFNINLFLKKTKLVQIHDISNRCAHYNVNISNPEAARFALSVGLGNCTGVGFGHIIPYTYQ